jgi:hypothetical protein
VEAQPARPSPDLLPPARTLLSSCSPVEERCSVIHSRRQEVRSAIVIEQKARRSGETKAGDASRERAVAAGALAGHSQSNHLLISFLLPQYF